MTNVLRCHLEKAAFNVPNPFSYHILDESSDTSYLDLNFEDTQIYRLTINLLNSKVSGINLDCNKNAIDQYDFQQKQHIESVLSRIIALVVKLPHIGQQ